MRESLLLIGTFLAAVLSIGIVLMSSESSTSAAPVPHADMSNLAAAAARAPYRAALIGATGKVGSALLKELLHSPLCEGVTTVGRRAVDVSTITAADTAPVPKEVTAVSVTQEQVDKKLKQVIVSDLGQLESSTELREALKDHDVAFITLGAGQPSKLSLEELHKIDVEYATSFGKVCKESGVGHISILTAVNTDPKSSLTYSRYKAEVEDNLTNLNFTRASFLRPALIQTDEARYGWKDSLAQSILPKLSFMAPARYHHIHYKNLARSFRLNAERDGVTGPEILEYPQFKALLEKDAAAAKAAQSGDASASQQK